MIDRIRNTSVLCYALISKINLSFSVKCYVLKKSIALNCIVDIRLRLFIKVDNLSVASTLEVEYSVVIPTVLIVTNQKTFRVCRYPALRISDRQEPQTLSWTDSEGRISYRATHVSAPVGITPTTLRTPAR